MLICFPISCYNRRVHKMFVHAMEDRLKLMVSFLSQSVMGYGRQLAATSDVRPIARGSLFELDTRLLLARDTGDLTARGHESLIADWNEVSKVLAGLIRSMGTCRSATNAESRMPNAARAAAVKQGRSRGMKS